VVKVWLNGSFDILHIGHIRLINHAASLGIVRVGLDTDERIREKKGMERPFNTLSDRIEFISSITGIDSVVSFGSNNELIERIREWEPDIMVIGDDYKYHEIIGVEYISKVSFFEKIKDKSTTKILSYGKTNSL
jgi:D-beta-D-heptose 7-phosphate kinase/D-beta-D-heptose 1-phosphate adenosyltransferase